jgi:hypothetical protein
MNRADEQAQRKFIWEDEKRTKGHWTYESTNIAALSSESAKGRAIVLVPDSLDATQGIEVLVFLHGFTEDESSRPFAGWRALDTSPATTDKDLQRLRQGVDPAELPGVPDAAPVRDVALDQAEQQLEESGQKQLVIVLPQGGLHSQFGKEGDANFAAGPYVAEVVTRLQTEQRWKDGKGKAATAAPSVTRINMAGHSGAGAALSHMADATKPSTALTGDLVIYDAINRGQLDSFVNWAVKRLDEALAVLTSAATDDEKLKYLQKAQKLRGYTTNSYIGAYIQLDEAINDWFKSNRTKLGAWEACLRANFTTEFVGVGHEELMRGSAAGSKRAAGTGTILDAIKGLHPALPASPAACPPIPKSLADRHRALTQPKAKPKTR